MKRYSLLLFLISLLMLPASLNGQSWVNYVHDGFDFANGGMDTTAEGGLVLVNTLQNGPAGQRDLYLRKIDGAGNLLWEKTYGTTEEETGQTVQCLADSGYLLMGTTYPPGGSSQTRVFLIRTDKNGVVLWTQKFVSPGSQTQHFYSRFWEDAQGNLYFSYYNRHTTNTAYLLKLQANGTLIWKKQLYSTLYADTFIRQVIPTQDGNLLWIGSMWRSSGMWECILVKTDTNGNLLAQKFFYRSSSNQRDKMGNVLALNDGGFLVSGTTFYAGWTLAQGFLVRFDSLLNPVWGRQWGTPHTATTFAEIQTATDGFLVVGATNAAGAGSSDGLLMKVDANGQPIWAHGYGTAQAESFQHLHVLSDHLFQVSGVLTDPNTGANVIMVGELTDALDHCLVNNLNLPFSSLSIILSNPGFTTHAGTMSLQSFPVVVGNPTQSTSNPCTLLGQSKLELSGEVWEGQASLQWNYQGPKVLFQIEQSVDGKTWQWVDEQASEMRQHRYEATVSLPQLREILYRIAQLDSYGGVSYSNRISLKVPLPTQATIRVGEEGTMLKVWFETPLNQRYSVQVFALTGQLIFQEKMPTDPVGLYLHTFPKDLLGHGSLLFCLRSEAGDLLAYTRYIVLPD